VTRCLFVSDLHGRASRYEALLGAMAAERPAAVFVGGDLLPRSSLPPAEGGDFLLGWLSPRLERLRERLGDEYPAVLAIFGNDDPRARRARSRSWSGAGSHATRTGAAWTSAAFPSTATRASPERRSC